MIFDDIYTDFNSNTVKIKDKNIYLSPKQFDIFDLLYRKRGEPLTLDALISNIYARHEPKDPENCVRVYVSSINKKIIPYGVQLAVVPLRGYKIADTREHRHYKKTP